MDNVPPRIVLDTNVCLDLFVFGDPRVAMLRAALHSGDVVAVSNAECREEWLRVLEYPQLRLDEAARASAIAAFDTQVRLLPTVPVAEGLLPRCADPDDQKFLLLAHASGARWLLSRDDALLVLARRTRRDGLFEILSPDSWRP
ncbi:putative toxin-antitoxin system toxin component, PIN family [Lysobacter sp. GCM10012299]|uniref:PIN domain-containing protein n=1 Tax=Lysobacter sp. GCM10012299 TaxID=3317333 RepID=UPI003616C055